jgi:hypothetical protein
MNTCYSSQSHRLARLFSFGLLDGPQGIAVSRNGRLTKTRPAHYLAGVHTRDALLFIAPCALREATPGFGLSRFATYS